MSLVRRSSRLALVGLLLASAAIQGCGGSDDGPSAITISATLTSAATLAKASNATASASSALAGYQLYCVTFANPPDASAAIADANGQVSLSLPASGVPFGCFILDPDGKGVASVMFTTGGASGQTVSVSADVSLGTIVVDLSTGIADADLPPEDGGIAETPSGVDCPVGTWVYTGTDVNCGDETLTIWVAKTPEGYATSYTWVASNVDVCPPDSQSNLPSTLSGGVLSFDVREDLGLTCNDGTTVPGAVIGLHVNDACTSAGVSLSLTNVSSCMGDGTPDLGGCVDNGSGPVCTCGTATCSIDAAYRVTRQ
jgi:hypothetical protein